MSLFFGIITKIYGEVKALVTIAFFSGTISFKNTSEEFGENFTLSTSIA